MLKISTNAKVSTAVAPFLPPVHSRIREITGLTARVINRMSSNDNIAGVPGQWPLSGPALH